MPTFAPVSPAICELTPTTSPLELSSGPPELPWLIAASVWIESLIVKLFGACIDRWRALTIPLVTVSSRPNGLPIATTPCPTATASELPSVRGCRTELGASSFSTARSVEASLPTSVALYVAPFHIFTEMDCAPSTTCSFVITWPLSSRTKPEPSACWLCDWPNWSDWPAEVTVISTTPLLARWYTCATESEVPAEVGTEFWTVTWRTTVFESDEERAA